MLFFIIATPNVPVSSPNPSTSSDLQNPPTSDSENPPTPDSNIPSPSDSKNPSTSDSNNPSTSDSNNPSTSSDELSFEENRVSEELFEGLAHIPGFNYYLGSPWEGYYHVTNDELLQWIPFFN